MNIIGTAVDGSFIVTATLNELARVAGAYNARYGYTATPAIKVGARIDVAAMYDRLIALRAAESELAKAQNTLRAVADLIDPIRPTIIEAQKEPQE